MKQATIIASVFGVFALVFFVLLATQGSDRMPEQPLVPSEARVHVHETTWDCEVANTDEERAQGLSDRLFLPEDNCMIFLFEQEHIPRFWMKDMHFALDFLWVLDGEVVDISTQVPPPTEGAPLSIYKPVREVDTVIELNAGQVEKSGVKIGDSVSIDFSL